ncbi:MAG: aminopeptidase P family protein [Lachnospiraceae bacterium]|nr:aminopeptidase P family protein [Lachnospiraceae bacterium]
MAFIDYIRKEMVLMGYDWFFLKDCDPHMSEYVNDYYKFRTLVSSFTGSNGTLAIGMNEAYLFTDGRYFIQAEAELKGTGIELIKLSTPGYPSVKEFIKKRLEDNQTVACPSDIFSYKECLDYGFNAFDDENKVFLNAYKRCFNEDYPEMNAECTVNILPLELTGECAKERVQRVRDNLIEKDIFFYFSATLDVNMWLLNLRGNAIKYNPMALSYVMITKQDAVAFLYVPNGYGDTMEFKKIISYLNDNKIKFLTYHSFEKYINFLPHKRKACFAFDKMPLKYAKILENKEFELYNFDCNVSKMKAIKNETEIENIRKAYSKDNKAVIKFIDWINAIDVTSMDEYELSKKLDEIRLSDDDCFDLSFDTISASGANAAMMHYEAKKNNCSKILNNNLYLFDSGGQYKGGTTDITRTIAIGTPTYEMKHDYTKVARGMLSLMNAVFLEGCSGINLDILAREPMWEEGDDYKCGTGHGIGYMLSVHEGPQAVRWMQNPNGRDAILKSGMLLSDEPGIYREGKYGIRIENILLVRDKFETPDGKFLCFECLTYVPLDEKLLLREEMSEKEIRWLDDYQNKCRTINQ